MRKKGLLCIWSIVVFGFKYVCFYIKVDNKNNIKVQIMLEFEGEVIIFYCFSLKDFWKFKESNLFG